LRQQRLNYIIASQNGDENPPEKKSIWRMEQGME